MADDPLFVSGYSRTSRRITISSDAADPALAAIVDAPRGRDDAPVAVLAHCFTCNKDLKALVRLSRRLAENGVTCVRFDMTGLGGSEGDFSATDFTTNVRDLRRVVGEIGRRLSVPRLWIGHSFGGAACLALAGDPETTEPPDLVATLAAPSDTVHLARLLRRMNPGIEAEGVGDVTIGGRTWTIPRRMLEDFDAHDLPGRIAAVRCAVLALHSPTDETVGFDHAVRIESLVRGADRPASVVTLPDTDHLLTRGVTPDSVADIIAAYFNALSGPVRR